MRLAQLVEVAGRVGARLDVQLEAADAVRTILAHHRRRHDVPVQRLAQAIGGHFALVERARGEVAERDLAAAWLVDGVAERARLAPQQRGKRVVGAPGDQLDALDRAALQEREGVPREGRGLGEE
jgi:hypothetical protein